MRELAKYAAGAGFGVLALFAVKPSIFGSLVGTVKVGGEERHMPGPFTDGVNALTVISAELKGLIAERNSATRVRDNAIAETEKAKTERDSYVSEIQLLRIEVDAAREKRERLLTEHEAEVTRIKREHAVEMNELRIMRTRTGEERQNLEEDLAGVEQKRADFVATLAREFAQKQGVVDAKIKDLEERLAGLSSAYTVRHALLEKDLAEATEAHRRRMTEISLLKDEKDQERKTLLEEYARTLGREKEVAEASIIDVRRRLEGLVSEENLRKEKLGALEEKVKKIEKSRALPSSDLYSEEARQFYLAGDYDAAIEADPTMLDAYNDRGRKHRREKQYDLAIADFTKAIELDPDFGAAYFNRGFTLFKKNRQYEKIIADNTKAIELGYELELSYNNRGYARLLSGDCVGAIEDFTRSLEKHPTYAMAHRNRAYCDRELGDVAKAIAGYQKSLEYEPGNRVALLWLQRLVPQGEAPQK